MLANRKLIEVKGDRHVIPGWIKGKTQRVLKIPKGNICEVGVTEARDEVTNDSKR
ncbi:MAG: hypothetical protein GW873_00380 [Nitrospirae bacterium]|nr:hypothetical protein [Nitrospirota bacterium]